MTLNDLIGIPFDADNIDGINCHELMRLAHKTFGIEIPKYDIAECSCKSITDKELARNIAKDWKRIDKLEKPCGILFESLSERYGNHIAVYIGKGKIIHTRRETGCIVERLSNINKKKIIGYYKFVGDYNDNCC